LGAPCAPFGVHRLDVRNPDVEEAIHPIWVGWGLERDGRLVVGWTSSDVDDDPAVCQLSAYRGVENALVCRAFASERFKNEAP
jgi:hypothetical protein